MAHTLLCPNGHQTLVADVFAGRTALCGVCGSIVRPDGASPPQGNAGVATKVVETPAQPVAAPRDQEDDVEVPAEPPSGSEGVYRGLGFHYFKTALALLATILLGVLMAIAIYLQMQSPEWVRIIAGVVIIIVLLALAALWLLAAALGILGSVLCLSVPRATGARPLIVAAFVLEIMPMVLFGIGWLLDLQGTLAWPPPDPLTGFGPATRLASLAGVVCGLLSWTFFLLFLGRLSQHFRDRVVALEAVAWIGRGWAVVAGWLAVGLLLAGLAWLDAHRRDFDQSLILGVGLFVLISVPLILWASLWVQRGILDLIGSVRHIVLSRSE